MSDPTRFKAHEQLMSRMAEAQGADLERAMQFGKLTPDAYTDAVLSCTGCSDPVGCREGLRQNQTTMPEFCRNQAMIRRIAVMSSGAE